ncbi:beta-1,6-N-acetylglucosaminyltransferase [Acinetobacter soli]|uniref:beta-1,6-N-acetylglucosaminyltransferase n=1 Tax=Acinetobacter soli TaxID=487316 RepID=UPI00125D5DC2|nr:beta-1,6-N-acetylglucosaminyltransferase [Acinetobacter soli]MCF3128337.1 beta-1,6-N-acetylglucosaminyltransferase [Acinetobacter soli]
MTIAFLIEAHDDYEHLQRLVNTLKEHDVYIHLDEKSGNPPEINNAIFISNRISVFWAGFSQIDATMALVEAALKSGKKYDRFILLSGSCYPIRPIEDLLRLFSEDNRKNYINSMRVADSKHLSQQTSKLIWRDGVFPKSLERTSNIRKIERYFRALINLVIQFFPKKKINYELYHGSNWWVLTEEAVSYVLNIYKTRKDINNFFKFTFASDEKYFQTLLRSGEFVGNCTKVTENDNNGTCVMPNLHLIDPSLSKWFTINDFGEIKNSSYYFVRKVRSKDGKELIDRIDSELLKL